MGLSLEWWLLIAVALAALVAFVVVRNVRRALAIKRWLTTEGAIAEAEIVRVWQEGHGAYCLRYRFTPQGAETPVLRETYAGCLAAAVPAVGDRVRVRYDPQRPERSQLELEQDAATH